MPSVYLFVLQVGLMRDGQLLAESDPNALINSYRMRVGFCSLCISSQMCFSSVRKCNICLQYDVYVVSS